MASEVEEIEALCDRLDRTSTIDEPQACADLMDEAREMILRLAALRSKDREDGARERKLHPHLADALAELGRHEAGAKGTVYWWRRASMKKLAALGLTETWLPKSLEHYKGKTLPYRLTEAGRQALAGRDQGEGKDG